MHNCTENNQVLHATRQLLILLHVEDLLGLRRIAKDCADFCLVQDVLDLLSVHCIVEANDGDALLDAGDECFGPLGPVLSPHSNEAPIVPTLSLDIWA